MGKIKTFSLLFAVLFGTYSFSQIPGLTQFTTNNNLPSNTIYDIVQDENGFMWFATDYGVSKFDGLVFNNFTVNDGLAGNEVLKLFKDSKNRIWMSFFNGGICFFKDGKIYNSKNTSFLKNIILTKFVHAIFEDSSGNIWFNEGFNNIICLAEDKTIKNYNIIIKGEQKSSHLIIEDLKKNIHVLSHIKKKGKVFIRTKKISENSHKSEWERFNKNNFTVESNKIINQHLGLLLSEDNKPHFMNAINDNFIANVYNFGEQHWITNLNKGVHIFEKSTNYSTPKTILKDIQTTRAFQDVENNIWIGSLSNGVFLFPNVNVSGLQFDDAKKNDLHCIENFDNKLVVGNEIGEVIVLDKKSLKKLSTIKDPNYSSKIRQLTLLNNLIYILSDYNLYQLDSKLNFTKIKNMYDPDFHKSRLKNFKKFTVFENHITTANARGVGEINLINHSLKKKWNKRSTSIFKTTNDSLWIGTSTGLFLENKDEIKKHDLGEFFNHSIIYDIKNSKHGLLIASNSYGLGILKNGKFKRITTKNGLLSNYIKSITIDSDHNIWLASNFGLNKLTLNNLLEITSLASYNTSDGLYSNDIRDCFIDINSQKAYVATSQGLNIIDISKESKIITPPAIHITNILLNNVSIKNIKKSEFDSNSNNIQFNFSGISFKSLGNISFKYRLLGIEKEWIKTKNNTIRYSSLQPKKYTFEVKAISKNNLESIVPQRFDFTIKPPIYKTWWFQLLTGFLLILIFIFIYYRRHRRRIEQKNIEEKISALRFKALNAQMNPHFINNLLENINGQIGNGKFKHITTTLQNFANLVNLVLQSTKSNLISLDQELAMVKNYLELQRNRFNNKIHYSINTSKLTSDDLEYTLIPPMILQPIVENSIKHGFKKSDSEKNTIDINLYIDNNEFVICEISDNGIGLQSNNESKGSGISLENIQNRLQLMGDIKTKENLVSTTNITNEFNTLVGLKVTLKIPLVNI